MPRKRILPYAVMGLLALSGACSKDSKSSTEPTGSTLTDVEFNSMLEALNAIGSFAPSLGASPATSRGLAAQQSLSVPIDQTEACPSGGTMRIHGTLSGAAAGDALTGNLTQTYSACKAAGSTGTMFTFNGSPNMELTWNADQTTGAFTMTIHQTGAINWGMSSKSGSCPMDLNIAWTYTAAGAYSGSYTGTTCGRTVNQTY